MIRNRGANFCQVIKRNAVLSLQSFVILTNHSWKGEAAIFTINASNGIKTKNEIVNFGDL